MHQSMGSLFFFFNSTRTNEPIENDESADERSTTALESKMLFLFFNYIEKTH